MSDPVLFLPTFAPNGCPIGFHATLNPHFFPSLQYLCIEYLWKQKNSHKTDINIKCISCFYAFYRLISGLFGETKGVFRLFGPDWRQHKIYLSQFCSLDFNMYANQWKNELVLMKLRFSRQNLSILVRFLFYHILYDFKIVSPLTESKLTDMHGLIWDKRKQQVFFYTTALEVMILQAHNIKNRLADDVVRHDEFFEYVQGLYRRNCPNVCTFHEIVCLEITSVVCVSNKISKTKIEHKVEAMFVKNLKTNYFMTREDYKKHCLLRNYDDDYYRFHNKLCQKYAKMWRGDLTHLNGFGNHITLSTLEEKAEEDNDYEDYEFDYDFHTAESFCIFVN